MKHYWEHTLIRPLLAGAVVAAIAVFGADAQAQQNAAEVDTEKEEILVTGSRIARDPNLASPVPVTSVDAQDLQLTGETNIIDAIDELPSLISSINSATTTDAPVGDGPGAAGQGSAIGTATINLRGLGTDRTLVLVDGKRHVAGRPGDVAVNINTIPTALVERVEVLTGGASAIYGADAVSGVVNFIMKDDFEGVDARAQFGLNEDGNGESYFVSVTAGGNFANDRGNAVVSVEYNRQSSLLCGQSPGCRDHSLENDQSNPALRFQEGDNIPDGFGVGDLKPNPPDVPSRIFLPADTFAISSELGRIAIDFFGDSGFGDPVAPPGFFIDLDNNGVNDVGQTFLGQFGFGDFVTDGSGGIRLFNTGLIASFANQFGGDGIFAQGFNIETIIPEQDRVVASGRVTYDLAPWATYYADIKGVFTTTFNRGQVLGFNDLLTVTLENPFIPPALRNPLDDAIANNPDLANSLLFMTRDFVNPADASESDTESYTMRIVTGFEGEFGNGINWDASFNYGRTQEDQIFDNRIEDRFFAAIDVVTDPVTGEPACRSEVDPSAPPPPTSPFPFIEPGFRTFIPGDGSCEPINLFDPESTPEGFEFALARDLVWRSTIEQYVLSLSLAGDTESFGLSLPAGPIGWAAGTEYRKEEANTTVDPFTAAGLVFDGSKILGGGGSYDVWEGFGEVSVPLLADQPFAQELTLDAAVRFADYSTVGSTTSWKVGGTWTPVSDIRIRGGFSRAIRAPNIVELFQPETAAFFRPIDPCDANEIPNAPDPNVRAANCMADGIPADFTDPLTGRFAGVQSGNANLQEETADTITIGAVFSPSFLEGLNLSIDYWSIDLDDAIDFVSAQDIVNNCYDDPNGINNSFCALVGRNRDMSTLTFLGLNFIQQSFVNIGGLEVAGVDFELTYNFDLGGIFGGDTGDFIFKTTGTYYDKLNQIPNQLDPDFVNPELKEFRRPAWVVNPSLRWLIGDWLVNYDIHYVSNTLKAGAEIENRDGFARVDEGDAWVHDISAIYQITDKYQLFAGINNIGDRGHAKTLTSFPVSPLGRSFFFGVNAKFGAAAN